MVMVRLHRVTTRYDPGQYRSRAAMSRPTFGARVPDGAASRRTLGHTDAASTPEKVVGETILDELSLTILDGETLSIVGPSGCGKSTLLRVTAGLLLPTAGEVYFDGQPMSGRSPRDRRIGMVFQNYALYPHMAAGDNIGFFWRLKGRRTREVSQKVRETAALMGMDVTALLGRLPRRLSGGEQQRVAVARCLSRDPAVFLLDEPFSNLDAHLRERSRRQVKKLLMKFAVTTIFVTHDQQEATAMGDRIAVMRQGKIVQVGTFRELYEDPHDSFVAGFLGDPPISLLACYFDGSSRKLTDGGGLDVTLGRSTSQFIDGQQLLLGLRPDRIQLAPAREAGTMRGHISHCEPRIADRTKIVYVSLAPQLVAAKVPFDTATVTGEAVGIRFDPEALLLFDAETHRRLPLPYQANA
jgi:ABC-type sugar transport system ATPase subunit